MNYYKCFSQYAQILPNDEKEKALTMLKKSISNGYISHIKEYFKIFMLNYEIEDIPYIFCGSQSKGIKHGELGDQSHVQSQIFFIEINEINEKSIFLFGFPTCENS